MEEIIIGRLPATLQLGGTALVLSLLVGIPLGIYAAYWRGTWIDRGARFFAVLGQAAPPFWVAIILILILSINLGVLPTGGRGGLPHLVLPAFSIALANIAGITRLMRSSMLEALESDYVRFLRVKGLPDQRVLWKHGLRNAGLPVLTFAGILAVNLITGSVVVEVVFVWPGIGRLLIESIASRDFPTVQGIVLILAGAYVVMNLVIDLLYAYLNPRLRTS